MSKANGIRIAGENDRDYQQFLNSTMSRLDRYYLL